MNRVEVVVAHWKRPANIQPILDALRSQTIPVTCTVTDTYESDTPKPIGWDRHFLMPNMGAWNRIAIAGAYDHEFTLLLDDDVLPCPSMCESFLNMADGIGKRFACLGYTGRRYQFNAIHRIEKVVSPEWCNWITQCYFLNTADIHWTLRELHRAGLKIKLPSCHFDAVMGYGITRNTGQPCYVIPEPDGMDWANLSQEHAVSKNDGYEGSLLDTIRRLNS